MVFVVVVVVVVVVAIVVVVLAFVLVSLLITLCSSSDKYISSAAKALWPLPIQCSQQRGAFAVAVFAVAH